MRVLTTRRQILFAVAAFAAVLIYLISWVTYAGIHYIPRYGLLPPGASGEVEGTTVRVLSLIRADQLADAKGLPPAFPQPGAVWIVAELEAVRHNTAKEFSCGAQLLGPQHRLWSTASVLVNRVTPSCPLDPAVGQTVRFESVFMVPARFANQLSGIALSDNSTAARTPVIRPS
jgi:hypothetical protein